MSLRTLIASAAILCLSAQPMPAGSSALTVPSGCVTLTVAASTGAGATPSALSFPLQGVATQHGQMTGQITGITASTVSNAAAGWNPGELSQSAAPCLIQLTSGAAQGRTFLISTTVANTATTLTLDPADAASNDLTTLGILSGDTYEILPADTLLELLGTPAATGVLGGSGTPSACDLVQLLLPEGWVAFYYDTTANHWLRASGPPAVSDNVVIRPDTGLIYNRYAATPLVLTLLGRVPSVPRQAAVLNSGPTALATGWPTDLTLGTSSLQTLPGWVPSSDLVQIFNPASGWRSYAFDGTHWHLAGPPHLNGDNLPLPAGGLVIIVKAGSGTGQSILSQALPYPLTP